LARDATFVARFIMRTSTSSKLFLAASVALAGIAVCGCSNQSIPDGDAPGGIMSGTEYERNRNTRGSGVDVSSRGGSLGTAHTTAGAGGAGGTTTGDTPTHSSGYAPAAAGAGAAIAAPAPGATSTGATTGNTGGTS